MSLDPCVIIAESKTKILKIKMFMIFTASSSAKCLSHAKIAPLLYKSLNFISIISKNARSRISLKIVRTAMMLSLSIRKILTKKNASKS